MEEAHEFEEDDYEELLGRLRGSVAHWNQLILTTNPDSPIHWINRRLILGEEAVVHYSAARDNPYNAKNYDNKLDKMTGTKRDR
jgi:phage terminase large subunit